MEQSMNRPYESFFPPNHPFYQITNANLSRLVVHQNALIKSMISESSKFVDQIEIIKSELAEINKLKQAPVVPDLIGEPDKASLISALYKDES